MQLARETQRRSGSEDSGTTSYTTRTFATLRLNNTMAVNSPRSVRSNDPAKFAKQLQRYVNARAPTPDSSRQRTKKSGLPYAGYLRWRLNNEPSRDTILTVASHVDRVTQKHPSVRVAFRVWIKTHDAYGNPVMPQPDSDGDDLSRVLREQRRKRSKNSFVRSQHLTANLSIFSVNTENWLDRLAEKCRRDNFDDLLVIAFRLYIVVLGPKPKKKRGSKKPKRAKATSRKRRVGRRSNGVVKRNDGVRRRGDGRKNKRAKSPRVH